MSTNPGKFIVIDGTDGSGKTTQFNLLVDKLKAEGFLVEVADFPQYNTKSAGLVEEYLSGKYGSADEVTPYQSSIFYAIDRYDASFKIRQWIREGKIVIANRYVSASLGHQGGKIENPLERKVFFNWLYELEYKLFNIPKPDLSLILHVEASIAQQLAAKRHREDWIGKTRDIHEENLDHLKKAEQIYLEIAQTFPDFKLIKCTRDGEIMDRQEIHDLVWIYTNQAIGGRGQKTASGFRAISEIISGNPQIINNKDFFFKKEEVSNYQPSQTTEIIQNQETNIPVPENNSRIIVERIKPEAKLPTRAHDGDAGLDLYANEYCSVAPYQQGLIATGIKMIIPYGYAGLIWDKSGLATQGITNLGGVIDTGYRGEVKVIIKNLSEDIINIEPGQKIAQILIQKVELLEPEEGLINDQTERQAGAFGSSGSF
ncbi:MAG: dUTP diphosphatase [Candidatus Falkowbacteria bacterium]